MVSLGRRPVVSADTQMETTIHHQVLGSSSPHGSLRLLEKPSEGTELLHGSQSPYPREDSVWGSQGPLQRPLLLLGDARRHTPCSTSTSEPLPKRAHHLLKAPLLLETGQTLEIHRTHQIHSPGLFLHGPAHADHRGNLQVFTHTYISVWTLVSANKDYKIQKNYIIYKIFTII